MKTTHGPARSSILRWRAIPVRACIAIGLLSALPIPVKAQQTYVSTRNGAWDDAATWSPVGIPGARDTAVIATPHTVGMWGDPFAVGARVVGSIHVDGILTAHYPLQNGGASVSVYTTLALVNGTVVGEFGDPTGGRVLLSTTYTPSFPTAIPDGGLCVNHGTIRGGNGSMDGGDATVYFVNGSALNTKTIVGGDGQSWGGNALLCATNVVNRNNPDSSLGVRGGSGLGPQSSGGVAEIRAHTWPFGSDCSALNDTGATVIGGNGTQGGDARVAASCEPEFSAPAVNEGPPPEGAKKALIRGGDGCPAGRGLLFGQPTINHGQIEGGQMPPGCTPPGPGGAGTRRPRPPFRNRPFGADGRGDPPDGYFTGGTTIDGDLVELSARDSLIIGDLSEADAIHADRNLALSLAPGGVLDLRNLSSGTAWLTAGDSIIIRSDTILLDPGVTPDQIMSPAPILLPGERRTELMVSPDAIFSVVAGDTIDVNPFVLNASNVSETLDYTVQDSRGWWSFPHAGAAPVGSVEGIPFRLLLKIPSFVLPGDEDTITALVSAVGGGVADTMKILVRTILGSTTDASAIPRPEGAWVHASPNPFAESTVIQFEMAESGASAIDVFDVSGRLVRALLRAERLPAGLHRVVWNGRDRKGRPAAAGAYLVRVTSGDRAAKITLTLIR